MSQTTPGSGSEEGKQMEQGPAGGMNARLNFSILNPADPVSVQTVMADILELGTNIGIMHESGALEPGAVPECASTDFGKSVLGKMLTASDEVLNAYEDLKKMELETKAAKNARKGKKNESFLFGSDAQESENAHQWFDVLRRLGNMLHNARIAKVSLDEPLPELPFHTPEQAQPTNAAETVINVRQAVVNAALPLVEAQLLPQVDQDRSSLPPEDEQLQDVGQKRPSPLSVNDHSKPASAEQIAAWERSAADVRTLFDDLPGYSSTGEPYKIARVIYGKAYSLKDANRQNAKNLIRTKLAKAKANLYLLSLHQKMVLRALDFLNEDNTPDDQADCIKWIVEQQGGKNQFGDRIAKVLDASLHNRPASAPEQLEQTKLSISLLQDYLARKMEFAEAVRCQQLVRRLQLQASLLKEQSSGNFVPGFRSYLQAGKLRIPINAKIGPYLRYDIYEDIMKIAKLFATHARSGNPKRIAEAIELNTYFLAVAVEYFVFLEKEALSITGNPDGEIIPPDYWKKRKEFLDKDLVESLKALRVYLEGKTGAHAPVAPKPAAQPEMPELRQAPIATPVAATAASAPASVSTPEPEVPSGDDWNYNPNAAPPSNPELLRSITKLLEGEKYGFAGKMMRLMLDKFRQSSMSAEERRKEIQELDAYLEPALKETDEAMTALDRYLERKTDMDVSEKARCMELKRRLAFQLAFLETVKDGATKFDEILRTYLDMKNESATNDEFVTHQIYEDILAMSRQFNPNLSGAGAEEIKNVRTVCDTFIDLLRQYVTFIDEHYIEITEDDAGRPLPQGYWEAIIDNLQVDLDRLGRVKERLDRLNIELPTLPDHLITQAKAQMGPLVPFKWSSAPEASPEKKPKKERKPKVPANAAALVRLGDDSHTERRPSDLSDREGVLAALQYLVIDRWSPDSKHVAENIATVVRHLTACGILDAAGINKDQLKLCIADPEIKSHLEVVLAYIDRLIQQWIDLEDVDKQIAGDELIRWGALGAISDFHDVAVALRSANIKPDSLPPVPDTPIVSAASTSAAGSLPDSEVRLMTPEELEALSSGSGADSSSDAGSPEDPIIPADDYDYNPYTDADPFIPRDDLNYHPTPELDEEFRCSRAQPDVPPLRRRPVVLPTFPKPTPSESPIAALPESPTELLIRQQLHNLLEMRRGEMTPGLAISDIAALNRTASIPEGWINLKQWLRHAVILDKILNDSSEAYPAEIALQHERLSMLIHDVREALKANRAKAEGNRIQRELDRVTEALAAERLASEQEIAAERDAGRRRQLKAWHEDNIRLLHQNLEELRKEQSARLDALRVKKIEGLEAVSHALQSHIQSAEMPFQASLQAAQHRFEPTRTPRGVRTIDSSHVMSPDIKRVESTIQSMVSRSRHDMGSVFFLMMQKKADAAAQASSTAPVSPKSPAKPADSGAPEAATAA
jgi:hypothetical protein